MSSIDRAGCRVHIYIDGGFAAFPYPYSRTLRRCGQARRTDGRRQERGEQAQSRQERAELEHEPHTRDVGKLAEERSPDATEAERKPEEQPRDRSDSEWHELLPVDD